MPGNSGEAYPGKRMREATGMRYPLATILCLAHAASFAVAAERHLGKLPPTPSCEAVPMQPSCGCNRPEGCPHCRPPCQPPCNGPPREGPPREGPPREGPPPTEYIPQEVGAYIAAPRTGTTRGGTSYRGVELGGITFPEIRLRLPAIELPACFRGHTAARMMVEPSVAQWQSQGYVNAAAGPNEAALRGEIDRLQKELDDRGDPRSAQDRASLERAACEEYTQKLRQYEQQLQRINDERRALEECIRQCLDQHNRAAVIPSPEMGCIDPRTGTPTRQAPVQSPLQKSPQQAPYPQPVPDAAQRLVPLPPFPTQPAAYHAEPAPLPTPAQFAPRPIAPPQQHWIREPAAPAARITGFVPGR
jgi:hypothetical protein